jgi:mannosyltransferase OCH1-like enzyme
VVSHRRRVLQVTRTSAKGSFISSGVVVCKWGYYADADDRCGARIDSIIPNNATLVLYQEEYGTVANSCIAVVPRHPAIGLALKLATSAINRGDSELLWLSTGPRLLTRALCSS